MKDSNDPVSNFLAERTNGEIVLLAFFCAIILFAMGVAVGQAIGGL